MKLRAFGPGKVNLCLLLGPLRADGRHELATLIESVSLADELHLETLAEGPDQVVCPGVEGENLVALALAGLRARGWDGPPVRIEIDKRVPVAAGMGGGSADAAATLRLAAELAPGRPEEVIALAAQLGADVPSQLAPGVSLATGIGDIVEACDPLAAHGLLLVPQPCALSTAEVYREADRLGLPRSAEDLDARFRALTDAVHDGARLPSAHIVNDLQPAALSLCPAIESALEAARDTGADEVLVSGSGPTVAGLFWGSDGADRAAAAARSLSTQWDRASSAVPVSPQFGLPVAA
jgi:4-diphosphocytidyl-2-C-methyl-D-erythritol kinase